MKKKISAQTMTASAVEVSVLPVIVLKILANRLPDRFSRLDLTSSGIYGI